MKQQSTTNISGEEPDDEILDVLDELEKIHPEKSLPKLLSARRITSESESSGKTVMVIIYYFSVSWVLLAR